MNKAFTIAAVLTIVSPLAFAAAMPRAETQASGDILYQVSTLDALLAGDYSGRESIGELRSHGTFGLGTFDALDGEMIVLDGVVYRAAYDCSVQVVPDNGSTPFASVTYFENDDAVQVAAGLNLSEFSTSLLDHIDSRSFYAIKVKATFSEVTVRSVPRQVEPYPPLADVLPLQSVRVLTNVGGTLIGIYSPPYIGTMDSPGFHFHFITDDRTSGGHILGLETTACVADLDLTATLQVALT